MSGHGGFPLVLPAIVRQAPISNVGVDMTRHAVVLVLIATLASATRGRPQDPDGTAVPHRTGLVEEVGHELVQLEVHVDGPPELVASLGPADLDVVIGGRRIERFAVDRACPGGVVAADAGTDGIPPAAAASPYRTSYLFYFDQHHLRIEGRARALELARSLVPEVLRDGGNARIVSAGLRVQAFGGWTDDPAELLDALDRLEHDRTQLDMYPTQEDLRVAEVLRAFDSRRDLADSINLAQVAKLRSLDSRAGMLEGLSPGAADTLRDRAQAEISQNERNALESAMGVARDYQRDERAHARSALERFALALGVLGEIAPPKAVIYFADTVRANPGDHYVKLYAERPILEGVLPAFDEVIRAAAAHGARLYTVQAAGLTTESGIASIGTRALPYSGGALATSQRFGDAKSALAGLAAETGGRVFLHGASAETIARRLHDDLDCLALISFAPGDLPRDRALSVRVVARRQGVRVSVRPSVVVRGEATRRRERIAQAFLESGTPGEPGVLSLAVIPTDTGEDHYSALIQIALPPVEDSGTTWEVGVSLVTESDVVGETAGRAVLDRPGVPLIYEAEIEFPPGPYELIAVAHDGARDRVVSARVVGRWPDLGPKQSGFGPLIALQPVQAAFVRGDSARRRGSRGLDEGARVDPAHPLALVGLACGGGGFTVERRLVGESANGFPEIRPAAGERCVLFRDVVPAGTLGGGNFAYEAVLRSLDDGAVLGTAERRFVVPDAADLSIAESP